MWNSTIEKLTFPTVSDYNRLVPDYTAEPTGVPIRGVDLQPGASTELESPQRRDATEVRWTVFVKPSSLTAAGVTLDQKSIVRVPGGEVCQVDGRPMAWLDGSPLDHFVVTLTAWEIPGT